MHPFARLFFWFSFFLDLFYNVFFSHFHPRITVTFVQQNRVRFYQINFVDNKHST